MARVVSWSVWVLAAANAAVLLVLAGRYGFHRDELYFLEAGRHLAFGYVDQPPLVPALARLQRALFGESVAAIRVVPALVSATTVVLGARLAHELGGGRRAQLLAAGVLAGAGFVLATGHLLATATLDFALWMGLLVVAARLLRTAQPRWWVAFGALAGVALWNKHLVVLLVIALLAGMAVEGRGDLLWSPWLVAGGVVAVLVASPVLAWQATNGWPQLHMARALSDRLAEENRVLLLPLQLVMLGPLLLPLGWAGVHRLWGRGSHVPTVFRSLLWAYPVALVLVFATGGRPYYPLPLAAAVLVAGAVDVEHRWPRLAPGLVAISGLAGLVMALPVLSLSVLDGTPLTEMNDTLAEQIGWEDLVHTVASVVDALPADEQDDVVLLTGTYGEAGAIDRFGPALGLPPAHSGHNSYWHWRRPQDDDATVVAVRLPGDVLAGHFASCEQVATVDNGVGMDNEVHGAPVWVCRGLRGTWGQRWPAFRHYG